MAVRKVREKVKVKMDRNTYKRFFFDNEKYIDFFVEIL